MDYWKIITLSLRYKSFYKKFTNEIVTYNLNLYI